jgi:hypothetical protein
MFKRNHLLAGLVAASFAAISMPTFATVYVTVDPPPLRHEVMEPRAGFVIVPGNWEWRNNRHHWVAGHYVAERKGYNWQGNRWVQHDNRRWTMQQGGWARDSDGDGVPDRNDNHPNDPRRN